MQRVAELVEQRLRVVERDQHRLARRPLTKLLLFDVIAVAAAVEPVLRAVAGGPRARALARAREVVAVEQAAMCADRVLGDVVHLPDAHVGMEHRHLAGDLGEAEAVELLGRPERRRDHVVQLEVRLQLAWSRSYFALRTFSA